VKDLSAGAELSNKSYFTISTEELSMVKNGFSVFGGTGPVNAFP
jgi:hypothetical protein